MKPSGVRFVRMAGARMLFWDATCCSPECEQICGDQEEMGFGVRVAAGITNKSDGVIASSSGLKTAKCTWGRRGLVGVASRFHPARFNNLRIASPADRP